MRLPVNTVIHTTSVGLEPATFRSLVDCWSDALPVVPLTYRLDRKKLVRTTGPSMTNAPGSGSGFPSLDPAQLFSLNFSPSRCCLINSQVCGLINKLKVLQIFMARVSPDYTYYITENPRKKPKPPNNAFKAQYVNRKRKTLFAGCRLVS